MRYSILQLSILLVSFSFNTIAYALAPVVDGYNDNENVSSSETSSNATNPSKSVNNFASFSLDQRMAILERQIANLNPLLIQIDDINQKMQRLQGKVEEQEHKLKLLEGQVRTQYQALDQRFSQRQAIASVAPPVSTLSPTSKVRTSSSRQVQLTPPSKVAPVDHASSSSIPSAAGERAYQTAFQLLKNKQYLPAIEGFETFIKKYPRDVNRPNANYFLGQLYLLQGQPEQSIGQFNHFVNFYTQDPRVPDALLQLGLAYFAKGEKTTAMDTFRKIIQHYPDSKAAQSAQARLQQFQAMISSANRTGKHV